MIRYNISNIKENITIQKIYKFFIGAFISFGINIIITYIGVDILGYDFDTVYLFAMLVVGIITFLYSLYYTFTAKYSHTILYKYAICLGIFNFINYCGVQIFVSYIGEYYKYGIIISMTGSIFFLKFYVYDRFVFS